MINLHNGDCLEVLKTIPDKSVNLVLTDPPYNIKKADWDNIPDYINWCGKWLLECQRVLKDNGTLYFFHNDIVQIAQIMEFIRLNTDFKFNSFCIWDKGDFRALSWKNPSEKNNLRCWFNTCEYCLVFVKMQGYKTAWDHTGWDSVRLDVNNFKSLRDYFEKIQNYTGLTKKAIIEKVGQRADHCFRWNSTQWNPPTLETYEALVNILHIDKMPGFLEYEELRREYEELRQEYEELRQEYEELRFTHNLDANHKNIWYSDEPRNDGKLHPTQKPTDILERIIRVSSNNGDVVLDPFLGSGSTGVACMNTGRKFIGIELDTNYFNIAKSRINEAFLILQNRR